MKENENQNAVLVHASAQDTNLEIRAHFPRIGISKIPDHEKKIHFMKNKWIGIFVSIAARQYFDTLYVAFLYEPIPKVVSV